MLAEDLKVYRDSYTLFHVALDIESKLPRNLKYTLGSRIIDKATALMEYIESANTAYRNGNLRAESIEGARASLNVVNLYVRLCFERHSVSHALNASYAKISTDVGRQLTGWLHSCVKGENRRD